MAEVKPKPVNWPGLIGLQQRAMAASDVQALAFLVANETWHLIPYRQAMVFLHDTFGRPQLKAVSGLVSALEDTPFTLWLRRLVGFIQKQTPEAPTESRFTAHDLPETWHEGWQEWWPEQALRYPLITPDGQHVGEVFYVRDEPWTDADMKILQVLHPHYAHCFNAFRARTTWIQRWRGAKRRSLHMVGVAALVSIVMAIPVRLSVLAPAEIIALKAEAVAAPTDGVVKLFHVPPNQSVRQGDRLFSLDDTTLRNRRDVALQSLSVARAEALAVNQRAFDNPQSRAEVAALQGRVREREAEMAYLDELLGRLDVVASHDGIFVYGDPNDWIGRPVVTGERIAQLAHPDTLGVLVWVPVADAIAMHLGAEIKVYLQTAPLNALSAALIETSYQATLSPENIASYRVRGRLLGDDKVHIGLRGVAKVYGERQPLIYWIMRRPLGAVRQWVGL